MTWGPLIYLLCPPWFKQVLDPESWVHRTLSLTIILDHRSDTISSVWGHWFPEWPRPGDASPVTQTVAITEVQIKTTIQESGEPQWVGFNNIVSLIITHGTKANINCLCKCTFAFVFIIYKSVTKRRPQYLAMLDNLNMNTITVLPAGFKPMYIILYVQNKLWLVWGHWKYRGSDTFDL